MTEKQLTKNPQQELNRLITGSWVTQAVAVFVKLEIADHIKDGAKTADELAEIAGVHGQSLARLLRALTTIDVVEVDKEGRFRLTDLGHYLRSDVKGSMAAMASMIGDKSHWLPWMEAEDCIRTGKPVSQKVFGTSFWSYLEANEGEQERFNRAMTATSGHIAQLIATTYDFEKFSTVADVGGGQGATLKTFLANHEHLKGILFDLPQVLDTIERDEKDPVWRRIQCEQGSFLESAPAGADLYFMKHIIHDWGDDECVQILKNIRREISDDGRVLIAEMIIDSSAPSFVNWLDLTMMIILGGKERTEEEFKELFRLSGFELTEVIRTNSPNCMIEGRPV